MQLATLLIGLISATALWSGVQALNQQARSSLRPRRRDLRRRAHADAGRPRRRDLPASAVRRSAPRRLAGLAGGRRPRPDRRALVPAARHRAGDAAGRSRQRAGNRPGRPANLRHAARAKRWSRRRRWPISSSREGATPAPSGGALLPPLQVQPQLVPGVLVVDIGIAQQLLNMPDQLSRLLIGKAQGERAPLESVAGDKLRLVEPDAETDLERLTDSFHLNLTAFGLLSFFVGLFIVNSAIGLAFEQRLPMLRTLRACGVSARHAEHGAGDRTGVAGAGRGTDRARLRLFDRGGAAARCRGIAARTLWRADSGPTDAEAGMVARRHRHQHCRRAGRRPRPA